MLKFAPIFVDTEILHCAKIIFDSGALASSAPTSVLGSFGHCHFRYGSSLLSTTRLYSSDIGRNDEILRTRIWNPVLNDFLAFLFNVDFNIAEASLPKLLPKIGRSWGPRNSACKGFFRLEIFRKWFCFHDITDS